MTPPTSRGCCGKKASVVQTESPIKKEHLPFFQARGFTAVERYTKNNIFYVKREGLTATGAFGGRQVQIRCGGASCRQDVSVFSRLVKEITRAKRRKAPR